MNCYERNNCKINCGYKVTSTHESDNSMASLQAAATQNDRAIYSLWKSSILMKSLNYIVGRPPVAPGGGQTEVRAPDL
jgi:hypothetical protein